MNDRKNKEGRLTLFLNPTLKRKLRLISISQDKTITQLVEDWIKNTDLNLEEMSKNNDKT